MSDAHDFDRRVTDVNYAALATRLMTLEQRVETLEHKADDNARELVANTKLTKQVHEAIFGRGDEDDDPGLKRKVNEVHDVFTSAKRGLAFLDAVADRAARWGKPVLYLIALCAAAVTFFKTGDWKLPAWPT